MKKLYTIYILSILLLTIFIIGCANVPKDTTTTTGQQPIENQALEPSGKITLSTIYKFNTVKTFSYRENTNIGEQRATNDVVYTVRKDVYNGADTYVLTSNKTEESNFIITDRWIDKTTNKCLQVVSNLISNGQVTPQPFNCDMKGPYSVNSEIELTSSGTEEINTTFGTFTSDTYNLAGVTYYVAKNIPVPLKVVYDDGSFKAVLTAYS